jgi:uncharacterized protein (UPF0332 family)
MKATLEELLASGRLKRHKASSKDIHALFDVVKRDLADAKVHGLSDDRRFTIAYNAVLQAGRAMLAAEGYRTAGQGHHATVFQALRHLLPKEQSHLLDYFDDCRSKRNLAEYMGTGVSSEQEVSELSAEAHHFAALMQELIHQRHPHLSQRP